MMHTGIGLLVLLLMFGLDFGVTFLGLAFGLVRFALGLAPGLRLLLLSLSLSMLFL